MVGLLQSSERRGIRQSTEDKGEKIHALSLAKEGYVSNRLKEKLKSIDDSEVEKELDEPNYSEDEESEEKLKRKLREQQQ